MKNDLTTKRDMYEVLKARDRLKHEVKGVGGMLAHLWRTVLEERSIGLSAFDALTADYIRKARRLQTSARVANYFSKSNIFRAMSRPTMTWKVFVKGMQLIGIHEFKVTIELKGRYSTTTHHVNVNLVGEVNYDDIDDEDGDDELFPPTKTAHAATVKSGSIAIGGAGKTKAPQVSADGPSQAE